MLEAVAGENGMVLLDVDLDLSLQVEGLQHAVDGADVVVVLVLGRLLRLRLDQDRALEADLLLVLDDHGQEPAELGELALDVRIEQRLVTLATAPQNVVGAAELMGQLEHVLHLRGGVGEHVGVRIGRRPGHVAAVGKEVRRAPEKADLRRLHLLGEQLADLADVPVRLLQRHALRGDVAIVKGEEGDVEQAEHVEGDIRLHPGRLHRIGHVHPRPHEGLAAEGIAARPGEGVPVADGEAEVVLHALAEHLLVGIVPAKGKRIAAGSRTLVGDGLFLGEEAGGHREVASLRAG